MSMTIETYDQIAKELLANIRGSKSQGMLNRKLGYQTYNQVSKWERGTSRINWVEFCDFAAACSVDLKPATFDILFTDAHPKEYSLLINSVTTGSSAENIANKIQISRRQVSRWLSKEAIPDLRRVLQIIDIYTQSFIPFILALAPKGEFKTIKDRIERESIERQAQYDAPYMGAMIMAFDLKSYTEMETYRDGFFAEVLGISLEEEKIGLKILSDRGLIAFENGTYHIADPVDLDYGSDFKKTLAIQSYWLERSLGRLENIAKAEKKGEQEIFTNTAMSISSHAYKDIRNVCLKAFRDIRNIVAADERPPDTLVVVNMQVLDQESLCSKKNPSPS